MQYQAVFIVSVLALLQPLLSAGHKMPRVPTLADLATVWVGSGEDGTLEYFRLELKEDGRGLLTVQYLPEQPAVAYAVTGTTLSRYRVRFELKAVDPGIQTLSSGDGHALTTRLDLEFAGETPKWKRKVNLLRYAELMQRLEAVTRRTNGYGARAQ